MPLYVQVPRLNIRRVSGVGRNQDDAAIAVLTFRGKRPESRKQMRHAVIDLRRASVGNGHRLLVEESQSILVGKRSFLQSLIENAIAAPEHGLAIDRSEEHTSELQSLTNLVCRLL